MSFLGGSYESVFITFLSVDQDTTLFFLCFYLGTSYLTYSKPTPVFLPGESQGPGAWWAAVHGVAQSHLARRHAFSKLRCLFFSVSSYKYLFMFFHS